MLNGKHTGEFNSYLILLKNYVSASMLIYEAYWAYLLGTQPC